MFQKVITALLGLVLLLVLSLLSGCQTDISGPGVSMKVMYKGENDNKEYLSRGAGMTSKTGYSVGNFGK